jgi:adenylate cyclase
VLRFPNVSAHHCQLHIDSGYWYVKDMNSRNGCKVNNERVKEKRLDPGDTVSVAKHTYEVRYSPADLGAVGPPPNDDGVESVFSKSLLERAGLVNQQELAPSREDRPIGRYDVHNDDEGQIKDPNRPV